MSGNGEIVVHLADRRPTPSEEESLADWKEAAAYMMRQNRELLEQTTSQNSKLDEQAGKIDRLLHAVTVLTEEMHDYRTGKKDRAYARLARSDEAPDLLRARGDLALDYPDSSGEIGDRLGLTATQVGVLLGAHGLKWAGDSDYQELTRWKKGRTRFWHKDVASKLHDILANRAPDEFGITKKDVRAIFTAYKARLQA